MRVRVRFLIRYVHVYELKVPLDQRNPYRCESFSVHLQSPRMAVIIAHFHQTHISDLLGLFIADITERSLDTNVLDAPNENVCREAVIRAHWLVFCLQMS